MGAIRKSSQPLKKKLIASVSYDLDVVFKRFSHLSEGIFSKLDNKNLAKCRKIIGSWRQGIDNL